MFYGILGMATSSKTSSRKSFFFFTFERANTFKVKLWSNYSVVRDTISSLQAGLSRIVCFEVAITYVGVLSKLTPVLSW
jgi:hypothetical protein